MRSGAVRSVEHGKRSPGMAIACLLAGMIVVNVGCGNRPVADNGPAARYKSCGDRVDRAAQAIIQDMARERTLAAGGALRVRRARPVSAPVQAADAAIPFRVQGIVRNARIPLVLTSSGVVGLGEELAGFKVVRILDDGVVFEDSRGLTRTVGLYQEASP